MKIFSLFFVFVVSKTIIFALPQGQQVVNGSAEFTNANNTLQITATNNSIIDYSSFNIANNEVVNIIQANSSSKVLNRVMGQEASQINGQLLSNGNVYLVNPHGIFFGPNSIVKVADFFAIAGQLSNQNFLDNINRFTEVNGEIKNFGQITGKNLYFIGKHFENKGVIDHSLEGASMIICGENIYLGENDLEVLVDITKYKDEALVNEGIIEGDTVFLGAGDFYSILLKDSSNITAKNTIIQGQENSKVTVSGNITAKEEGSISITGDKILINNSLLDASSENNAGNIFIGGSLRGKGPLKNASTTIIGESSLIKSDATNLGNGGTIIVYSKDFTKVDGWLSACGGTNGGKGGFIETSGFALDIDKAKIKLSSIEKAGTWLIDPKNITVVSGCPCNSDTGSCSPTVSCPNCDENCYVENEGENSYYINLLSSGCPTTDIQITNQTINNAMMDPSLEAVEDIYINAPITLASPGEVDLADITAGKNVNINSAITTGGSWIGITAHSTNINTTDHEGSININAPIDATDTSGWGVRNIYLTVDSSEENYASGNIYINAPITASYIYPGEHTGEGSIIISINAPETGDNLATGDIIIDNNINVLSDTDGTPGVLKIYQQGTGKIHATIDNKYTGILKTKSDFINAAYQPDGSLNTITSAQNSQTSAIYISDISNIITNDQNHKYVPQNSSQTSLTKIPDSTKASIDTATSNTEAASIESEADEDVK